jgi:LDH2 family malate/lactate/ureidoglycolate dehydrogenase
MGAMRIDAFRPVEDFKKHMDHWIRRFRSSKAIDGKQVLIPGDPERENEAQRRRTGIPLMPQVIEDLEQLAERFALQSLL